MRYSIIMENHVRNHVDVRLLTRWDGRYGAEAMIAKPNFHNRSVFSENLVAIEMCKLEMKFDKPIYVGISSTYPRCVCMNFITSTCYCCIMKNVKLCILIWIVLYYIECDIYDIMKRNIAKFDMSDYPTDNAYGIPLINKKVPGLMKDENNGTIMNSSDLGQRYMTCASMVRRTRKRSKVSKVTL